MEEMPLSESSPRGAERFRRPWLLWLVALLLMLLCSLGTVIYTSLKIMSGNDRDMETAACSKWRGRTQLQHLPCVSEPAAIEPCMVKCELLSSKWQMTSPEPHCVNMTSDRMLKILQKGVYLFYGEVVPVAKEYIEGNAPFLVQIVKNKNVLQILTNDFQILHIGGIYELHAGDTIELMFNLEEHIQKNKTYWGIILMPNLPFIS